MIKILCDRCGRNITTLEKVGYIAWSFKALLESRSIQDDIIVGNHYCPDCMNEIKAFIQSESNPPALATEPPQTEPKAAETVSEPEKVEQPKRKRIDIGKIMALKNAGWSIWKDC